MSKLAILGGEKIATRSIADNIKWPIVNRAMEEGVLSVLRDGNMSGTDITKQFEVEFFANDMEYSYDIDAASGNILSREAEVMDAEDYQEMEALK